MFSWYKNLANPLQALIAGIITFLITALGSAIVVFFKKPKEKFLALTFRGDYASGKFFLFN